VCVIVDHFIPSLTFSGKARILSLELNPNRKVPHLGRPLMQILDKGGSDDSDKFSRLLQSGINYSSKSFIVQASSLVLML
jgi:hypothetical protein